MEIRRIHICPLTAEPCSKYHEIVAERCKKGIIRIYLCYQFKSTIYSANELITAFEQLVSEAQSFIPEDSGFILEGKALEGGIGSDVFCRICRDIQMGDIALCEITETNPNVYLELGLSMGTDTYVLPIRYEQGPKPSSDIAGLRYISWNQDVRKRIRFETGSASYIAELARNAAKRRADEWAPILVSRISPELEPSRVTIVYPDSERTILGRIGTAPKEFIGTLSIQLRSIDFNSIGLPSGSYVTVVNELNGRSARMKLFEAVDYEECILGLTKSARKTLDIVILKDANHPDHYASRFGHKLRIITT